MLRIRLDMSGQIVDATLVAAPRQRNAQEEKAQIKEGLIPDDWKRKPAKLRHKDRDARWTVKFSKAKERPDGTKPPVDIAIPSANAQTFVRRPLAIKTMLRLIAGLA